MLNLIMKIELFQIERSRAIIFLHKGCHIFAEEDTERRCHVVCFLHLFTELYERDVMAIACNDTCRR